MTASPHWIFTDHQHGDLRLGGDPETLAARRAAIHPAPWTWLRQVHGNTVIVAEGPGDQAGATGDAVVTTALDTPVAVHTADCAPVLLLGDGIVGVAHAGWRGLAAGVIEATADVMRSLGAPPTSAILGPSIRPRCYEFGSDDLAAVATRYGPNVVSTTAWGTPALDVAAGVHAACAWLDIELTDNGVCTACSPAHWSHRARADVGRQAVVAWLTP